MFPYLTGEFCGECYDPSSPPCLRVSVVGVLSPEKECVNHLRSCWSTSASFLRSARRQVARGAALPFPSSESSTTQPYFAWAARSFRLALRRTLLAIRGSRRIANVLPKSTVADAWCCPDLSIRIHTPYLRIRGWWTLPSGFPARATKRLP